MQANIFFKYSAQYTVDKGTYRATYSVNIMFSWIVLKVLSIIRVTKSFMFINRSSVNQKRSIPINEKERKEMKENEISGHFVSLYFISFCPMNIYTPDCMGVVCFIPLNLGGVIDAVHIHKN